MAQKHQPAAGSTCPGCDEPLEPGDRFCGACGYDLSAVPAASPDRPTVAIGTRVEWPAATGTDTMGTPTPTQRAADVRGTDSDGGELSPPDAAPGVPPQPSHAPVGASGGGDHRPAGEPGTASGQADGPARAAGAAAAGGPAGHGGTGHGTFSGPGAAPGYAPDHHGHERPAAEGPPVPAAGPSAVPAAAGPSAGPAAGSQPQGATGREDHERAGDGMSPAAAAGPDPVPGGGSGSGSGSGSQPPVSGVRFDNPPPGDFELAAPVPGAPDPRAAAQPAPPPAPQAKVCVACRAGRVDDDGYCENCGHAQPRERDHMEQELGSVAAVSDRGLRHHRNEDAFAVSSTALPDGSPAVVAVVCDGVSSATRPDEASAAAASTANERLLAALPRGTHPQQAMHEAIVAASEAVNSLAEQTPSREGDDPHRHQNAPACTIVGAVAAGGLLVVGWVGDSRAYWVPDDRSGPPARLTEDDSWAAQMVAAGLMNEAEAYADERAHAITGWLGADAYELEPHTAAFKPDRPGVVVVCTDGLWNYAEGAQDMARAIPPDAAERPLHSAQMLVGHALDGGGHDNVTVAVLPFAVPEQGAGSA
ncbi:protein phosphatase 2C domain-containing protein [Streptomyces sp. NPDC096176]|uniref:protein phosphatase 2C domain-containing protein n=1 Tax=Streptomyces sp. NPDC096176 TaxID=3366079 RepID=UPI00380C1FE9